MSRSLKLFVAISVLLNLLLLGVVCGHLGRTFMPTPTTQPTAEDITAALPADKRAVFDKTMEDTKTAVIPLRKKIENVRRESLCIVATDPFDKKAYLAKVDELHTLHQALTKHIVDALVSSAASFTPEERIAFMDMLRPPPPPKMLDHRCTTAPANPE